MGKGKPYFTNTEKHLIRLGKFRKFIRGYYLIDLNMGILEMAVEKRCN